MDPLHLHHQADGIGIALAVAGTAAHGVDEGLSLIALSPFLCKVCVLGLYLVGSLLEMIDGLKALLILLTGINDVENLEQQGVQNCLVQIGGIGFLAPVIVDRELCSLPERRIHKV